MAFRERFVQNIGTMNLRRAAIFVRVVEESGFTAAARALDLPKSAVSSAVSLLEDELGVRLLHRSTRKLTLTEAGAALHQRAAPALRALDEASAAAVDAEGPLRGTVRMTAPVEVGTRLLEPLLARFLKVHPGVRVDLRLTTRVLDFAEEGIDLAVRGGPIHDDSLVARKLGTHDAGLFASPSFLRAHRRPRSVADLARYDCVAQGPATGPLLWTLDGPDGKESVEVTARLTADHFAFLVRAVVSGVGIGLLPLFLCDAEAARGDIVRVLPKHAMGGVPLHLLWPSSRYVARPVAALRDHLLKGFAAAAAGAAALRPPAPRAP